MNTITTEAPLSIRRLDIPSIVDSLNDQQKVELAAKPFNEKIKALIHEMIARANRALCDKNIISTDRDIETYSDYSLYTECSNFGEGFSLIYYTRTIQSISDHLANLMILNPDGAKLVSNRVETIGFLFRQKVYNDGVQRDDLYVLAASIPSKVVSQYIDIEFSQRISRRLLDPKVQKISYKSLVENHRRMEKEYTEGETLLSSRFFDKQVIETTSKIRLDASIFKLPFFQNPSGRMPKARPTVTVRAKSILFNKQLKLNHYPVLLDHLSVIHHGQTTVSVCEGPEKLLVLGSPEQDSSESQTHRLVPVQNLEREQLEKLLSVRIWSIFWASESKTLTFSHSTADWTSAHTCSLLHNNEPFCTWDGPITAFDVFELLRAHLTIPVDAEALDAQLSSIQYSFKIGEKTTTCSLRKMFSGEFRIPETQKPYFLMHGKWFALSSNYVQDLYNEYAHLLRESIITGTDSLYALSKAWPTDQEICNKTGRNQRKLGEKTFNQSFIQESQFVFGDQILVEQNIEFFDLQKVTQEGCIWYFVKKGYGQHTRDATSQMRISASLLYEVCHAANSNNYCRINALCEALEKKDPNCLIRVGGKEQYIKILLNKPVTFVYALYEDNHNHLKLEQDAAKKDSLSPEDFYEFGNVAVCDFLKKLGFLNAGGYITPQMRQVNKTQFKEAFRNFAGTTHDFAEKVYNRISERTLQSHDSLIAPFELLMLQRKLKKYKISFKIDLISAAKTPEFIPVLDSGGHSFQFQNQKYVICDTPRNASCSFYAAFGEYKNNCMTLTTSPEVSRLYYRRLLEEILNAPNYHEYGGLIVQKYQAVINNLLFIRNSNHDNFRKFNLAAGSAAVEYRAKYAYHSQAINMEEEKLFKEFLHVLETGSNKIKCELRNLVPSYPNVSPSRDDFKCHQKGIEVYLQSLQPAKYSKSKENVITLNYHRQKLHELYQKLSIDQEIRKAYFHCLEDTCYWLDNSELSLMYLCYKTGLDIFSYDQALIHEEVAQATLIQKRVIFRINNYYFACSLQ